MTAALAASAWLSASAFAFGGNIYYARPDGAAGNNGSNWANAFCKLPATLERGAVYYLASGQYGSYTFKDAANGDQWIAVKKATADDHGPAADWNASYGEGPAVFDSMVFDGTDNGYVEVNGQVDGGIRIAFPAGAVSHPNVGVLIAKGMSHITLKYLDIAGPGTSTGPGDPHSGYNANGDDRGLCVKSWQDVGGGKYGYKTVSDLLVSHCRIHGADSTMVIGCITDSIFEHNVIYDANVWNPGPQAHPNMLYVFGITNNIRFRYNEIYNWSCEGFILSLSGPHSNWFIYGNVWHDPVADQATNVARIVSARKGTIGPVYFYNNTIVGSHLPIMIEEGGSFTHDSEAKNNLIYHASAEIAKSVQSANNLTAASDPFVNSGAFDYHLKAGSQALDAGTPLGAEFNTDKDGKTRGADGKWAVGAYANGDGK
jgi:hypothetical protein